MTDIFLSYATEDREVAQRLVNVFVDSGWSVFWDREIPVGKSWDRVLEAQLPQARIITALWSPRSVNSDWVMIEATEGMEHQKLFPAMIEQTQIPLRFKFTHYADLSNWDGTTTHEGCTRLLTAIANHLGRPLSDTQPRTHDGNGVTRRSRGHEVFVAYARDDEAPAEALVTVLSNAGISVWWDRAIMVGESFDNTILEALEQARAVVTLWSKRAIASEWVRAEAQWAINEGKLINATLDTTPLPIGFSTAPTVDLTHLQSNTASAYMLFALLDQHGVGAMTPSSHLAERNKKIRVTRVRRLTALSTVVAIAVLLALLVGIYLGKRFASGG